MVQAEIEAGRSLLELGRWTDARAAFEAALASQPSAAVLHGLAEALWWTGDIQASATYYQRAYSAYRDEGNSFGAAWAAIFLSLTYKNCLGNEAAAVGWLARAETAAGQGDPAPLQGWFMVLRGHLATEHDLNYAADLEQKALDHAARTADRDLELVARADLGLIRVKQGDLELGMAMIDESMAGLSAGENRRLDTVVMVCCIMLTACEVAADFERATQWSHVTDQFLATYGCPYLFAECRAIYGSVLVANGRWPAAEQELRSAISQTQGTYPPVHRLAAGSLALLKLRQGRLEEADALLTGLDPDLAVILPLAAVKLARGENALAIALLDRTLRGIDKDSIESVRALEMLVEAYLAKGDMDQAANAVDRLNSTVGTRTWLEAAARCSLAAGRLARARDDNPTALACFERAVDGFLRLGLPHEAGRAHLAMAEASRDANPELATLEAQAAFDAFEILGAHPDRDRAAGLLRSLGVASKPGPRGPGLLTDRETEVLKLLSSGLSNPEIADRLVISRKTAAHHVSNVLSKLGVRNRAEAVAYASRLSEDG